MSYREPPTDIPLIACLGGAIVALDPELGVERWAQPLAGPLLRIVVVGDVVFVAFQGEGATASLVRVYDLARGTPLRETTLDFYVRAAIARNDLVYFAGYFGLACFARDGSLRFRHGQEVRTKSAWNGDTHDSVLFDEHGRERARRQVPPNSRSEAVLVLGEVCAQPDFS